MKLENLVVHITCSNKFEYQLFGKDILEFLNSSNHAKDLFKNFDDFTVCSVEVKSCEQKY